MFSHPHHPNIQKRPYENGFYFLSENCLFFAFSTPRIVKGRELFKNSNSHAQEKETDPDFFFEKVMGKSLLFVMFIFFHGQILRRPNNFFIKGALGKELI